MNILNMNVFAMTLLALSGLINSSCGADNSTQFREMEVRNVMLDIIPGNNTSDAILLPNTGVDGAFSINEIDDGLIERSLLGENVSIDNSSLNTESGDGSSSSNGTDGAAESQTSPSSESATPAPGSTPDSGSETSTPGSTPDSGSETPAPGSTSDSGSASTPTSSEIKLCAAHFGVTAQYVTIAGNQKKDTRSISEEGVVAIKVTGNMNQLDLAIRSSSGLTIRGLCIFAAGNQSKININLATHLRGLVYYGRGNQTNGNINIESAGIIDSIIADLRGNQQTLTLSGAGKFDCPKAIIKGNRSQVKCG